MTAALRKPCDHRILDGFLGEDLAGRLLAYAIGNPSRFSPATVGEHDHRPEIRTALIADGLGDLLPELEARFAAIMGPALSWLGMAPFEAVHREIDLVAHGDGGFYRRHIDTRTGAGCGETNRVLTAVLYLHTEPRRFTGGCLRLYSIAPPEAGGSFVDIEPRHDRLALFPSWAPHEVMPVSLPGGGFAGSRFAVNCWFRARRAP